MGFSSLNDFVDALPQSATLIGRWQSDRGPTPILIRGGIVFDVSDTAATVAQLLALPHPAEVEGRTLGRWTDMAHDAASNGCKPGLLAPIDLQCVKAAGVTFAASTLERVIEERARGDARAAQEIRQSLRDRIGGDVTGVKPGSPEAASLKAALIADGLWSQYLEVAIGPDAELFTKAPILSSVGDGALVGVRSDSRWNNPEPEVVLVCRSDSQPIGATLGNDVNLRDIEGRSALLLGKAKDNNGSCALGPFIRLFDESFTLDTIRQMEVHLEVVGEDGFTLTGSSSMCEISRDPLDLVAQTVGVHHQYPDGFVLFLGTMFAPTVDRAGPGDGFTHHVGDIVRISADALGILENRVALCEDVPPWTFGVSALMNNLAARGLLPMQHAA